jgi:CRP-like cAMP-binding protein
LAIEKKYENHSERTMKDINKIVPVLLELKLISDYKEDLTDQEFVALAIATKFEVFKRFQPICEWLDKAKTVYFSLKGKIGVIPEDKRVRYKEKYVLKNTAAELKPGICFGDIGVLYGDNR